MAYSDRSKMWRKLFSDSILDGYNYDGSRGKEKINENPIFRLVFGKSYIHSVIILSHINNI